MRVRNGGLAAAGGLVADSMNIRPDRRSNEAGFAAHHAGMVPPMKEAVEEAFAEGLVKVVFATETLALGINMPARSVVIEKLIKWNGETHADITPGEYTQLTGRAGRRGIDVEGHGVVLWSAGMDPKSVAGLASTRTYPLRSSFRPSYNMAVNLVNQVGRTTARELLESVGVSEPGLNQLAHKGFHTLGLQTYLTAGPKESRAWTIRKGWTAPQAAGVIHTDFERGFIRAEVIRWDELLELGSWSKARDAGKLRVEGKEYEVQDGDVVEIRFNV